MLKQENTSLKKITTNIFDPKKFTYVRAEGITPDSTPEEDARAIDEMSRAMVQAIFGVSVDGKPEI